MAVSSVMRYLLASPKSFRVVCSSHGFETAKWSGGSVNLHSKSALDEIRKLQSTDGPATPGLKSEEPYFFNPLSLDKASHEMMLVSKPDQPEDAHVLRVAIIGTPNAGKSTLVNSLLGRRIFSVSKKVHTTRARATGVLTHGRHQIIFLDTPGMVSRKHGKKHNLPRPLMTDSRNVLEEADLVAVIIDVGNKYTRNKLDPDILMTLHEKQDVPAVLILNKVDLLKNKQELLGIVSNLTEGIVGGEACDFGTQKSLQSRDERKTGLSDKEISEQKSPWYEGSTNNVNQQSSKTGLNERTDDGVASFKIGPISEEHSHDLSNSEEMALYSQGSMDFSQKEDISSSYALQNVDQCGLSGNVHDDLSSDYGHSDFNSNNENSGENLISSEQPSSDVQSTGTDQPASRLGDEQKDAVLREYVRNLDLLAGSKHSFERSGESKLAEEEDLQRERKQERWKLMQSFFKRKGWPKFQAVFMVSALNDDGTANLKDYFVDSSKPGLWEFHSDTVTDLSPEDIVSEAIREQLLEHLPQEVPYRIRQSNDLWQIGDDGELQIYQRLICETESHVNIFERRKGTILRGATRNLMNAFHCEVLLKIHAVCEKTM